MCLVLTIKKGTSVYVGNIKVTVNEVSGNQVRMSFSGDDSVLIVREKLLLYDENNCKFIDGSEEKGRRKFSKKCFHTLAQ